ncbi:hypothetical protein MRX96_042216 [Rhipicephalus microplus]
MIAERVPTYVMTGLGALGVGGKQSGLKGRRRSERASGCIDEKHVEEGTERDGSECGWRSVNKCLGGEKGSVVPCTVA